jgi:hypothetical protein
MNNYVSLQIPYRQIFDSNTEKGDLDHLVPNIVSCKGKLNILGTQSASPVRVRRSTACCNPREIGQARTLSTVIPPRERRWEMGAS